MRLTRNEREYLRGWRNRTPKTGDRYMWLNAYRTWADRISYLSILETSYLGKRKRGTLTPYAVFLYKFARHPR